MKSGTASAPSGGGLAITERQKPAPPSRVAALFQMLAKRKLFFSSSKKGKLLPPVRAHKFSPGRPLAGGEKTAGTKMSPLLLDSADYSRSKTECNGTSHYPQPGQDRNCSENGMRAPGVVARLMGLSSMPAASHQRPARATTDSSEAGGHWNSGRQDRSATSRSIYTSPQQQQQKKKTRQQQLIDDRHHGNAGQFSAPDTRPLWPRRHAHRVASSAVKSPRSMSSRNKARLIEAAVRVLEPGLQSRNRRLSRRHAYLEYPCSNDDGAPSAAAAAVLHDVSDQFLRNICDADIPASGARNLGLGATSLHNYTSDQRTEEDTCKKSIPSRRSDQSTSCQLQPEYLPVSPSEKAGFGSGVQKTSDCIADTNQDGPRKQLKSSNMSRDTAPRGPLKQNNLKQNALPAACGAADPGCVVQSKKHRSGEPNIRSRTQDFVSLNKRMDGSASLRSKRKALDRFGEPRTSAENRNMMSTKGCRASGLHGGSGASDKLKLRTGTPRAMEKDMIIAKGAGLVSEKPKPASPNRARSGFQRQPVPHNVSTANKEPGIISLTSGSPVKAAPTVRGDNAYGTGTAVQVDTCQRNSLDCAVYDNKDPYEVARLRGTRKKHAADAKGSKPSPCISRDSNKRSPTSTLHSGGHPGGDACVPGIPRSTAEVTSTTSHPRETCTEAAASIAQDTTAERNPRGGDPNSGQHGVQVQPSELHPGEVTITTTVELLLTNVRASTPHEPDESPKAFLLRTTERALAALTAGSKQGQGCSSTAVEGKGASALRNLALDLVWDCLDSTCSRLCDSGYRSFSELLGLVCTEERLADRVGKEVARCCSGVAGKGLDELAVGEVERAVEAGMGSMLEAVQIGTRIEQDLVQELVDEIGADVLRRW